MEDEVVIFNRKESNPISRWWFSVDHFLLFFVLGAMFLGIIMVATASPSVAERIGASKLFFIKKHLVFVTIGLIILLITSALSKNQIKVLSLLGIAIGIGLLVLVLVSGQEIKGSRRWLNILGLSIQPSEFVKTLFIVMNAFILEKYSENSSKLKKYWLSTTLYLIIVALLILEPDFGMTLIVTLLWFTHLFLTGLPLMLFISLGLVFTIGTFYSYITIPHVADRINRFLDSFSTTSTIENYQVKKSLEAFKNGGIFGQGPGDGVVKNSIPDSHADFIFSVMGEEFGLVLTIIAIIMFAFVVIYLLTKILEEQNLFNYLAVTGLIMQFGIQTFINMGVALNLLPTKGMTLPFISYGGSSMLAMSMCFGIILALTKKTYRNKTKLEDLLIED